MKNKTQVIEKELKVTAEEFRRLYKKEEHSQIGKRVIQYTDAAKPSCFIRPNLWLFTLRNGIARNPFIAFFNE